MWQRLVPVRTKRVTDPLDEVARARLVGGCQLSSVSSSGSEHSAAASEEFPCLAELVHGFLNQDDSDPDLETRQNGYDSDSDQIDPAVDDCTDAVSVEAVLFQLRCSVADPYRNLLQAHVSRAMEALSGFGTQGHVLRRKVMSFLTELGHNAAVCKTKWDSSASGSLTAGNYEFLDVLVTQSQSATSTQQNRYIIDLEFSSQFEIARPTCRYLELQRSLPKVFVGKPEDLKRIVKAMCDVAKRSLKSRYLSLPPWRKNRYMQNKWFGPYRRTVNPAPVTATVGNALKAVVSGVNGVKCRCVGFDDTVNGRLFVSTR